jgi:hypothetical protein
MFKKDSLGAERRQYIRLDSVFSVQFRILSLDGEKALSDWLQGCLPYATQDFVDTGHGWTTPKGNSTGSLSGTTYALFACYNYNPLEIK